MKFDFYFFVLIEMNMHNVVTCKLLSWNFQLSKNAFMKWNEKKKRFNPINVRSKKNLNISFDRDDQKLNPFKNFQNRKNCPLNELKIV